jgi:hypothetical protein
MTKIATRNVIIASVVMFVALAAFGLMVYHMNKQSQQLSIQVETLEEKQAQEKTYFQLIKITEDSQVDRELLSSYFLQQEGDSVDVLNFVENLAPTLGLSIKTSGLDLVAGEDDWVTVTFSFSGSRDRVQKFIQLLENLPHVSQVMSAEMKALSSTEWQSSVTVYMKIMSYDE